METALIKGKSIPAFDNALIALLGTPEVDVITRQSIRQFAIENSEGEIYRIVGAENDMVYATLIKRVHDLRYRIEPQKGQEVHHFKEIARLPPEL